MRRSIRMLLVFAVAAGLPARLAAQGRVTPPPQPRSTPVRAIPGPGYGAGSLQRFLLGSGWRDLWAQPVTLPVLDLESFSGGLKPEREGGGRQSITLHFLDAHGRGWIFRSVDKYPAEKAEEADLGGTLAGRVVQDAVSALHPAGSLVIPPLLDALGVLHATPTLYVMPNDARLGEFRKTFAGMIGALEIKANEGEDDTPGFAGSTKIVDTEVMFERAEESAGHAVAQRELLRSRLLDFLIGDTDRSRDNHRWARFPHPEHAERYLWRPVPRDRDWAFIRPGGLMTPLARSFVFPKYVAFGFEYASLRAYTHGSHHIDRRFLNALDRRQFEEEAARVQSLLTDSVLAAAARRLPATYPREHVAWLARALQARRDALDVIAAEYYAWLASEVDVHGTMEADSAEIVRSADGSVTVTVTPRAGPVTEPVSESMQDAQAEVRMSPAPYYRRVFRPGETKEVRVYMNGGDDVALVRGPAAPAAVAIRVIGGRGDDVLADSSAAGNVHLYDAEGNNRFAAAEGTRVSTREWTPPAAPVSSRQPGDWAPDWGGKRSWGVLLDYGEAAGLILGVGPTRMDYGFRRLPYRMKLHASALVATRGFSPGADLRADYRFEGVPHSLVVHARWSSFDAFRWFGRGNDTDRIDQERSLVRMNRFSLEPAFLWRFGDWRPARPVTADTLDPAGRDSASRSMPGRISVAVGPLVRYTRLEQGASTIPSESVWQIGAGGRVELQRQEQEPVPRRGIRMNLWAAGYPAAFQTRSYVRAATKLSAYVPSPVGQPFLAISAGAARTWGNPHAFDAAAIGGRTTVRGFTARRWAGDAALHGTVELRVPVGRLPWILPAPLGAFALADAGRVFVNGRSPGGWHVGYGGGAWLVFAEQVVSVAYAHGESGVLYAWLGLPF